ncbi:MAG: enoyl-CoA hydratase-related protein, partial [Deltaproteobacteria bacterium]|nr:enoyl-CoA hydratase-related protein [Deltaproteobacteria bacterium]
MNYENIIIDTDGPVAVATLNRPKQLNALSYGLCKDLCVALEELDADESIRVFVITGGDRAFAAG